MSRPLRIEYNNAFYHITARGNDRKPIFTDDSDRQALLSHYSSATERYGAIIHAYCLMTNHYHLLLETPHGNLSQIMRHINGAYASYFNTRHSRVGPLLQGRYKAILVEKDTYAQELSRYIHLNPVRAKKIKTVEEYPWSSCRAYLGLEEKPQWLHDEFILEYFNSDSQEACRTYFKFLQEGIKKNAWNPQKEIVFSTLLGGVDFIEEVKSKYLSDKEITRDVPDLKSLMKLSVEEIIQQVNEEFGEHKAGRNAAIYIAHKYSGKALKEIGIYFGLRESGVSQASRRFSMTMAEDRQLQQLVNKVLRELDLSRM